MKFDLRRFALLFGLAFLLLNARSGLYVSAQQKQTTKPSCPVTKVTCPDTVYINDELSMTADVRGGDSNVTPAYNWTVSAGTIYSGQGTSTIAVGTEGLSDGETVTATVEIGGLDRECGYGSNAASCTTSVMKKPESRKLDEYSRVTPKEENERLDNFAIELQMDPSSQAYIIAYGGRASRAGDAQKAADKAKLYLVTKRGIDRGRIIEVVGGYREQPTIELWLVPSRAPLPKPTPTLKK